jgi:hypothetical protein
MPFDIAQRLSAEIAMWVPQRRRPALRGYGAQERR